jgi:hypothetical protein
MSCNQKENYLIEVINSIDDNVKTEEIKYSKLPDSLKVIINKSDEYLNWYAINSDKIKTSRIIVYNETLGYYEYNQSIANSFFNTVKNSNMFCEDFIIGLSEKLSELKLKVTNNYITDKTDLEISNFIDYDALFNSYEYNKPDTLNIKDIQVSGIRIFNDMISVFYLQNFSVCFKYEDQNWLLDYAE